MGKADYLKLGDWNAICQVCGFKHKASDMRKRWDGLYVCEKDYEERHPSDFFKSRPDVSSVAWTSTDSSADTNTTDISGNAIKSDQTPEVYGDESPTYTVSALTSDTLVFSTALTTARLLTIAGTPNTGKQLQIYRTAGGSGTLTIAGLYTIPALKNEIVVIEYTGSNWKLVSTTPIGL